MFGPVLFLLPFALLVTALVAQRRRTRLVLDHAASPGLARLDRTTLRARWAGVVLATVAAVAIGFLGPKGRGLFLVPAVFSLVLVACLATAESMVWRSARTPGTAALEQRRTSSYLPAPLAAGLVLAAAALGALLAWCREHQNGTPSEWGDPVGSQYVWHGADGLSWGGGGPFPGSFYSTPLGWLQLVTLVLLVTGIVVAVRRPRNGSEAAVVAVDDAARRRSIEALLAAALVGVLGELVAVVLLCLDAFRAIVMHDADQRAHWPIWTLLAVVAALMAIGAWAGAVVLVPGRARLATVVRDPQPVVAR